MQALRHLLFAFLALVLLTGAGFAQTDSQPQQQPSATESGAKPAVKIDKRKLMVQPRNADGSLQTVSFWEDPVLWMRDQQQGFYSAMSKSLREMRAGSPLGAALTLMLVSFAYGVFHAAGPGHGKAVISAWLLATESQLRRGIVISLMSALFQALTAITVVSLLLLLVASAGAIARDIAGYLESASYAMIGAMGLYLVWTALRPVFVRQAQPKLATAGVETSSAPDFRFEGFTPQRNAHVHADHVHGPDCDCGHAHLPEAKAVSGDWSLARAVSLAFAVGIRPCTGALLVLIFANAMGLYWAGVASTFAMAAGTFITVSAIAAIAVYSKKLALRYAARDDRWLTRAAFGLRLFGGTAIAGLGLLLFLGSLGTTNAMM